MALSFFRYFSTEKDKYPEKQYDVKIVNQQGETVFEQKNCSFPEDWSERARTIVASKYFYGDGENRENSLVQIVDRVVNKIVKEGNKAGYFNLEDDSDKIFADELKYLLINQRATFNSPVWFNIGNENIAQQASACYINSVEDTMESILDLAKTEGMIFKRGSGAGVNLSKLRPEGSPIYGGGTSSGPLSFMKGWDAFAGVIKSGGITRRAAKMIILDVDHQDVLDFIWCKVEEENKAKELIKAGYSPDIDGEAYSSIFYQNANHSIRVTNEFMEKAQKGETLEEASLLTEMARAAWNCGDPGIMYGDTMNEWNTCKASGEIVATNPCAEYIFLNDTSCNLASINLKKFISPSDNFDFLSFGIAVEVMITAMDILCGFADYPTDKIKEQTLKFRTLGLGYSNVGAMLMSQGIPYDSKKARNLLGSITSYMTAHAYLHSSKIAESLYPFPEFEKNKTSMMEVIQKHWFIQENKIEQREHRNFAAEIWDKVIERGNKYGFRNAQVTVIAPTGTISFMMDCESTGIEPLISPIAYKNLVGGGTLELVHECVEEGLKKLEFESLDQAYSLGSTVFNTAIGENTISSDGHLEMVAAIQPFLSGGVSKTINLPESATYEDIVDIYVQGWKLGLKNISIYRDNSKGSQPLNTSKEKKVENTVDELNTYSDRIKLPRTRKSITHKFSIANHNGYITVGLYEDGNPGEVFITVAKEGSTLSGLMDSFATVVSLGLQYGIPLEVLVEKMKGAQFEPSGFTGYSEVPHAKSIIDYIFKWLENEFIKTDRHLEQSKENKVDSSAPFCSICGGLMASSGPCYTCTECGDTTGGC